MSRARLALGRWGEEQAAAFLQRRGYQILERNARTPYGEIDLLARQGDLLVFVEVKTRSSASYGFPEESVTPAKQAHLLAAAQAYLQEHPALDGDWQVDVIAVQVRPGQAPAIRHFENVLR